jgi:hypothetical protein
MWWILVFVLQFGVVASGIRQEQRAGLWSWSKFLFALAFGALECVIVIVPITYIDMHSRYYVPVVIAVSTIAAVNFIWMIIVARRWKLPDGRTSLEAYRDQQLGLREDKPKR